MTTPPLATRKFKHFTVTPVTPVIGGTVEGLHLSELNEDSAAELREALWHYGVLFAPSST